MWAQRDRLCWKCVDIVCTEDDKFISTTEYDKPTWKAKMKVSRLRMKAHSEAGTRKGVANVSHALLVKSDHLTHLYLARVLSLLVTHVPINLEPSTPAVH